MEETKRKTLGSIIGIVIFIACLFSITYAFYKWRSDNTNVDIGVHAGGLKFVYSQNNILSSTTLSPVTDYTNSSYYENNNSSLLYVDYTVTNTKSTSYKMITKLNITSISDSLKNSTFKWVLQKKENNVYNKVTEGNFSNLKVGENTLNSDIYIPPNSTTKIVKYNYRFVIYIDGNQENSSTMMNSNIVSNLVLCDEEVKLFNISLDNQGANNTSGDNATTLTIYEKYAIGIYKKLENEQSKIVDENSKMTTSTNNITIPLKTGYTFGGYYTETGGKGDNLINPSGFITDKFGNTYFKNDSTIYAKWNINQYTMKVTPSTGIEKFNISDNKGNSETNISSYSKKSDYNTEFTVNNIIAKAGYTYSGYTLGGSLTALSGSTNAIIKTKLGAGDGNLTLNSTANTYNIKYSLNNGVAGSNAPNSATYDKVINISNPTKTIKATGNVNNTGATIGSATSKDQTFAGWTAVGLDTATAKYGNSSSTVSTSWSNGTTPITGIYFKNLASTNNANVTLTANWTPVSFNLPTVTKTGYTCHWNTKNDGSGTSYDSGASYTPTATQGNINLYAMCEKSNYTVTYNYSYNGGTSATKTSATVTYGDTVDLTPTAIRDGYEFRGWNTDENAHVGLESLKMPANNVTLYAIFRKKLKVTFKLNGNVNFKTNSTYLTEEQRNQTYTQDKSIDLCYIYNNTSESKEGCTATVTMPTITAPSNTPTVLGWSTAADPKTITYTSGKTGVTLKSGSVWYAQTRKDAVTLTANFDANGATLSDSSPKSCTLGEAYNGGTQINNCTVTTPTITRDTFDIKGWNTDKDAEESLSAYNSATGRITLTKAGDTTTFTFYAITTKGIIGAFYYYGSDGIKNLTGNLNDPNDKLHCVIKGKNKECQIPVPTAITTTTSEYGGAYVGYGEENNMELFTTSTVSLNTSTTYYAKYRTEVTEYSSGTSRKLYRNSYFTDNTNMTTVLSASSTGTKPVQGNPYTVNSISWQWKGYATTQSGNIVYSSIDSATNSKATVLYTIYSKEASSNIYYYTTSQQVITVTGNRLADYKGTLIKEGDLTVPDEVVNSKGPSNSAYQGLSNATGSTTTTTTINTGTSNYYAVYEANYKAVFSKESNVSTIGSSSLSCSATSVTNGTTYNEIDCSITLPTITPSKGYRTLGWYDSIPYLVGQPGDELNLITNISLTAKVQRLKAEEFSYDNTNTGDDCTDVQCMIDKLDINLANQFTYSNAKTGINCTNIQCTIDNLARGDVADMALGSYVSMTPTTSSYTTDTSKTGYDSTQTINPQELNLWRVISINNDGTVDVVSEHVSSTAIYFKGQTGYQNLVGYLNVLASQYENSTYTKSSRAFGYNGQTEYITDTSKFTNPAPWTCSTGGSCNPVESQGGGDELYTKDYNLVKSVLGTAVASQPDGTESYYWMASRYYRYSSTAYYDWSGRLVYTSGDVRHSGLYYYTNSGSSGLNLNSVNSSLRPVLTLKSGIKYTGSGTEADPYVLSTE